jgi:hypothetical protein
VKWLRRFVVNTCRVRYLTLLLRGRHDMKARCTAKTKAGKPCKAPPISGTAFCISHADKATRAKAGFGGSENGRKGGEAKRVPKLTELLRAEVEERAEEIIAKLFMGLAAQRAIVVGTGPRARLEFAPDPEMALKTIREIYDRYEGRPMQRQEVKGEITHLEQEEYREQVARLRRLVEGDRRNGHNGRRRSRASV